tara:strand:+ start:420 stop:1256 length:837 start_codon:yes stop_codon:yes gene_type:complete
MPDKKNVSSQAVVRKKRNQKDAIDRLYELEKKVEQLSVAFDFYGSSIDTFRDSIIDEIIEIAQKRVQEVSNQTIEELVNKRITKFKEGLYGRMMALDKNKQVQIDVMQEEIERNSNKILSQRTTITALEYELKGIYDKLKKTKLEVRKPEMSEQARYTRTPDSVRKREYNTKYNVGRVSLTKKQYHFLKTLRDVAVTKSLEEGTDASLIRFSNKEMYTITNVKSIQAFTRLLTGYGLMKKNKEDTPKGERGARYTWSLTHHCALIPQGKFTAIVPKDE